MHQSWRSIWKGSNRKVYTTKKNTTPKSHLCTEFTFAEQSKPHGADLTAQSPSCIFTILCIVSSCNLFQKWTHWDNYANLFLNITSRPGFSNTHSICNGGKSYPQKMKGYSKNLKGWLCKGNRKQQWLLYAISFEAKHGGGFIFYRWSLMSRRPTVPQAEQAF